MGDTPYKTATYIFRINPEVLAKLIKFLSSDENDTACGPFVEPVDPENPFKAIMASNSRRIEEYEVALRVIVKYFPDRPVNREMINNLLDILGVYPKNS